MALPRASKNTSRLRIYLQDGITLLIIGTYPMHRKVVLSCLVLEVVPLKAVRRYKSMTEEWDDLLMTQTKVIQLTPVGEKKED